MKQNLVGSIMDKEVYLVRDSNISFFISIPSENNTTIVLNLVDNSNEINVANNNPLEVKNKILGIYSNFINPNVAVVTPVIKNEILDQVKSNNPEYVSWLNKALGYLINISYRYLKDINGKQVYEKLQLNKNDSYKNFNDRFTTMYSNRIELVDYSNNNMNTNIPSSTVENTKQDESALANTTTIPLDDAYKEMKQAPEVSKPKKHVRTKEPGFVSYVLLGVIVAVISLLILYKLL